MFNGGDNERAVHLPLLKMTFLYGVEASISRTSAVTTLRRNEIVSRDEDVRLPLPMMMSANPEAECHPVGPFSEHGKRQGSPSGGSDVMFTS